MLCSGALDASQTLTVDTWPPSSSKVSNFAPGHGSLPTHDIHGHNSDHFAFPPRSKYQRITRTYICRYLAQLALSHASLHQGLFLLLLSSSPWNASLHQGKHIASLHQGLFSFFLSSSPWTVDRQPALITSCFAEPVQTELFAG